MSPAPVRPRRRARPPMLAALASALVLLVALLVPAAGAAGKSAPRAHVAASYLVGIGDEHAEMFTDPLYRQLHTKIARLIVGYDVVAHPYFLKQAYTWIHDAEAQHIQVLVAFYHSEYTATRLPNVALYQHDVQKFIRLFPNVKQYQSWDESNRGNVAHAFSSPSAALAARYYQALLRVCKGCTVLGLDVLDAANIGPTLEYIHAFKSAIGRLRTVMPKYWGLHNYSDVNRFESWRTRELPNNHGAGLKRAAQALKYMFSVASSSSRIKRLYIFDWTGGGTSTRFDAGLMDSRYKPRPGYVVVCRQLHAARCAVHTSSR
jgi:hypothetical protein